MQSALRSYARAVETEIDRYTRDVTDAGLRDELGRAMKPQVALDTELTPYKFHVSEDIYTSIVLHGDPERRWRSVMHPEVESKMLSPQDLLTWMIQRFKYAAGSLDIALHDAVFSAKNFRLSLAQKLMYGTTFWSYLACLWNTVFLISPLIYLFTGIPPVSAYSLPFYLHFLPFSCCRSWLSCSAPGDLCLGRKSLLPFAVLHEPACAGYGVARREDRSTSRPKSASKATS